MHDHLIFSPVIFHDVYFLANQTPIQWAMPLFLGAAFLNESIAPFCSYEDGVMDVNLMPQKLEGRIYEWGPIVQLLAVGS